MIPEVGATEHLPDRRAPQGLQVVPHRDETTTGLAANAYRPHPELACRPTEDGRRLLRQIREEVGGSGQEARPLVRLHPQQPFDAGFGADRNVHYAHVLSDLHQRQAADEPFAHTEGVQEPITWAEPVGEQGTRPQLAPRRDVESGEPDVGRTARRSTRAR